MSMRQLINYVPAQSAKDGQEHAFDENGEPVTLEFGWFDRPGNFDRLDHHPSENYVRLNGVIHRAVDIEFSVGLIEFWAEPVFDDIVEFAETKSGRVDL